MPVTHRIVACLVIVAQAILGLAVPGGAAHGAESGHRHRGDSACRGHAVAPDGRIGCGSPAGTLVLGIGGHAPEQGDDEHGCLDCGDGRSHLHVANVDETRDGPRRWSLPPLAACPIAKPVVMPAGRGTEAEGRIDRLVRPPPCSRRSLGSIVLRV